MMQPLQQHALRNWRNSSGGGPFLGARWRAVEPLDCEEPRDMSLHRGVGSSSTSSGHRRRASPKRPRYSAGGPSTSSSAPTNFSLSSAADDDVETGGQPPGSPSSTGAPPRPDEVPWRPFAGARRPSCRRWSLSTTAFFFTAGGPSDPGHGRQLETQERVQAFNHLMARSMGVQYLPATGAGSRRLRSPSLLKDGTFCESDR